MPTPTPMTTPMTIQLNEFTNINGTLFSFELMKEIGWKASRVFIINIPKNGERGGHAHLKCRQVIIVSFGSVSISYFDGKNWGEVKLESSDSCLTVPAEIWIDIKANEKSQLLVLASDTFSESDYIRDMDKFKEFKKSKS